MKKYKSLLPALLVLLFIVSGFQYEVKGQVEDRQIEGNWNGTISFQEKYTGALIKSGSWNETLINVTITDNKGRGTMKIDGELIIGGKSMGKVSCSGGGAVVLYDVVINPSEGTYRIVTTGPDCFNGTDLHATGSVTIDHEFQGQTPNVLSGTKTKVFQIPTEDGGTITTITRWNLVRTIDAELIVTPKNYDNWLPEPGRDELTKGTVMNIDLKVQGRNGRPLSVKAKSFELRLSNTSREPGITLNFPLVPNDPVLPDLRFLEHNIGESIEEDQFIEIDCEDGSTGKAIIGSYDGGGWTTLTVIAILNDNSQIKGSLLVPGGEQEILIPKRATGSKIATKWLNENGNPGESDDKDTSRGNTNHGDGLTAYEEYRGFISEKEFGSRNPNKFGRLDPKKKEVGVWMLKTEMPLFSEGISLFETASDLKVIQFSDNEIAADRKFNRNFGFAHSYLQYVLKLVKGKCDEDAVGQNEPTNVTGKIPKQSERVVVDVNKLKHIYAYYRLNRMNVPNTEQKEIAVTVAHELGHGIHISHHGHGAGLKKITVTYPNPRVIILDKNKDTIKFRPKPLTGLIGRPRTQASGHVGCIMFYNDFYSWALNDPGGKPIFAEIPSIALGKIFCTNAAGTDMNAEPNYFYDASEGNCLGKIKLK